MTWRTTTTERSLRHPCQLNRKGCSAESSTIGVRPQRLATCSSDRTIKIWDQEDQSERSGQWKSQPTCLAKQVRLRAAPRCDGMPGRPVAQAHNGSIWRVCWAHPEFGQVVASCSFDKTVKIWIELARKENVAPRYQTP
jgi:WD40 repeat protein